MKLARFSKPRWLLWSAAIVMLLLTTACQNSSPSIELDETETAASTEEYSHAIPVEANATSQTVIYTSEEVSALLKQMMSNMLGGQSDAGGDVTLQDGLITLTRSGSDDPIMAIKVMAEQGSISAEIEMSVNGQSAPSLIVSRLSDSFAQTLLEDLSTKGISLVDSIEIADEQMTVVGRNNQSD